MIVCIYGASSTAIDKSYIDKSYELAKTLAENGFSMVFGGGANGLMGASARGMTAGGGDIIGVAPSFFDVDGVLYEKCTEFIYTETMRERKRIMEERSEAFIVLPGGFGTFEEFFEILTLKQLERHNKPIVIYNIDGYYDELLGLIDCAVNEGFVREESKGLYAALDTPEAVMQYLNGYDINEVVATEKLKYIKK